MIRCTKFLALQVSSIRLAGYILYISGHMVADSEMAADIDDDDCVHDDDYHL